ncbi:GerAB/ArcD/ProY family transporter [Paenibacillus planticolens]|uniref:GerAB/ArcD/ProY family transporter n=1 Tax=Paenibacillus planticolens TaxID=2654976 RepID=A0ABX1ZIN6_9BACL|nr:GerAB/ArcD/ProY family transporter [Paenibacillus planticolens]NOU98701.1 GerAB/ArcD/ProY family transporter [Paenibacillus planticolens]
MEKMKINAWQYFVLILLFEFGTAIVVSLGVAAKKDAWIAILLGLIGGLILYSVYVTLFHRHRGLPLTGYLREILGKYIGWFVGLLYLLLFIYGAARDLRDAGDLLVTALYDQTPLFVVNFIMFIVIAYVLYKGVQVLVRTGEIFFLILVFLGIMGNGLVWLSGLVEIKNLLPVLENGWKPIWTEAFPQTLAFPFGEMICFTMLFPYLQKSHTAMKTGLFAMVLGGLVLSYTITLEISVLGYNMVSRNAFPLLLTISIVKIADFLQRFDAIAILTFIICDFFKIAMFYYASVLAIADLFKIKEQKKLVLPIGVVILFSSMTIASSFTEHMKEGIKFVPFSLLFPFQTVIPILLLLISWLRQYWSRTKTSP